MFSKREGEEKQGELWIESARVAKPKSQGFYSKLNEHLAGMDLARQVGHGVRRRIAKRTGRTTWD